MAQWGMMKAPYARKDGTGMVVHELRAFTDDTKPIRGRQLQVAVPQAQLGEVMAMPHETQPERRDKNLAYRDLLATRLPQDWSGSVLDAVYEGDSGAVVVAGEAAEYLTVVLGRKFPILFPAIEIVPDEGED